MSLTDILFLIVIIIAISTAVFLIYPWNTPNLKDTVDKEVEKQQQELFTGELTPHIKEAIDNIEVPLEEVKPARPTKRRNSRGKKK